MKYNYDEYYLQEKYFGEPYELLIDFFRDYKPKGTILDLGCGQGRDSLALAALGYEVTGVDESVVGIRQMLETAEKSGLAIKGISGDIHEFEITGRYDIILLDSMLHFYKNDISMEKRLVNKILNGMKVEGIFCNCMIKGAKRESILKSTIAANPCKFKVLLEDYAEYPEYDSRYHILIVQKERG
ncbi:MAG: methyltransferase domain-containing protein [Clostridia bacterium]|nr:methyltransferase domain-containing protein [Clostridia bacterium]